MGLLELNKKQLTDEKRWFIVFFLTCAELNVRVKCMRSATFESILIFVYLKISKKIFQGKCTLTSLSKKHSCSKNCEEDRRDVLLSRHLALTKSILLFLKIMFLFCSKKVIISVALRVKGSKALIFLKWI